MQKQGGPPYDLKCHYNTSTTNNKTHTKLKHNHSKSVEVRNIYIDGTANQSTWHTDTEPILLAFCAYIKMCK